MSHRGKRPRQRRPAQELPEHECRHPTQEQLLAGVHGLGLECGAGYVLGLDCRAAAGVWITWLGDNGPDGRPGCCVTVACPRHAQELLEWARSQELSPGASGVVPDLATFLHDFHRGPGALCHVLSMHFLAGRA